MTRNEKRRLEQAVEQIAGWVEPWWESDAKTMWQGNLAWTSVIFEDFYRISEEEARYMELALNDELPGYEFQVEPSSGTILISGI